MNRRLLVSLGLAALAWDCSSAPKPALEAPPTAAIDTAAVLAPLVRSLAFRAAAVRTLRGRADLEVSAQPWGGSSEAEAAVLAERPNRLHLRAYAGPVTAFDLVSRDGRFWAHVPDRHELWTGPVHALEKKTGIPVLGDDLVSALLGDPFGAPGDAWFEPRPSTRHLEGDTVATNRARLVSVNADRAVVEWGAREGGVARAIIRRLDGVPLSIEWWRDGARVASVRYDDYVHETEGPWPRKLAFHWNDPEASLRLTFHELQLNRDLPETSFTPPDPPGARQVAFGDADSSAAETR
jgi:hypothetical protein